MSYQINFTDSVNKGFIQVDDNTVNTETSLSFPGRTKSDYGQLILENLLHLLENFSNNNPPANPVEGQLWYDTTVGVDQLKVYDGAQWISASNIKKGNFRPEAVESSLGDLWVDTANQQLKLYNGNEWLTIGPEFSEGLKTGARPVSDIIDITNEEKEAVINYVQDDAVLIVSKDEFTPKSPIEGPNFTQFDKIKPGLNLAPGLKYYGISEAAESLFIPGSGEGNILASNFARRDRDNTFSRPIRIQNNGGISIGETPTIQLAVVGASNAIFRNLVTGGNIQFRLGSTATSVLTINPAQRVGINKPNPEKTLDIVGELSVTDNVNFNSNLEVDGNTLLKNNLTVTGNSQIGDVEVKNIIPDQTGRNIGTSSLRFNNIFSQAVNATTFTGNFVGPLSGNASSASGWSSSVTLEFNGDVDAIQGPIVFGTPGNLGPRSITLQLKSEFITNRSEVTQIDKDDELLIIREINNTDEIRKIKQENLVSKIPTTEVLQTNPSETVPGSIGPLMPVGAIMPYAGDILPNGWLFCDGTIVRRSSYDLLFKAIGTKFNGTETVSIIEFRLPDLRGRFPLGNLGMQNVSPSPVSNPFVTPLADLSTVVNDPESSVVGAKEGSANKSIEAENLPDHIHTLQGDADPTPTQFYAVSNELNAGDTGVDGLAPDLIGNAPGSFVTQTGSVIGQTGEDFSVVNPYQTVNYIIYTGVHN